jgi:hypothetical protein
MRTDHSRPLAAYGLVALVCALVMWQPSIGANVASRAPVVTALIDIGLSPGELLSRVVGGDLFSVSPVTAPHDELPAFEPEPVDDLVLFTPSESDVPGAGGGSAQAVSLEAGLIGADGGDGASAGGELTPGVDPGQPDGDGKPGTDAPQGGRAAVPDHPGKGPKDKGDDHPGKGPKDKGDDHPGKGPKDKGDDHPGKGPKDKGSKDKGSKDKGSKDKDSRAGSDGRGPKG